MNEHCYICDKRFISKRALLHHSKKCLKTDSYIKPLSETSKIKSTKICPFCSTICKFTVLNYHFKVVAICLAHVLADRG